MACFKQQACWMIEPLAAELSYSIPSVRRFLSQNGYFSSFTHNGCWYTLRTIPKFNHEGLWFNEEIGFSRFGSLTKTLVHLASRSPAGLTAEQLGEKLRCRCHSVLVHLYRKGSLLRERKGRSNVYFSATPKIAEAQRQVLVSRKPSQGQLSAEIAVLILVEFIQQPGLSFEQLAQKIRAHKKVTVDVAQIEGLFNQHGLKKTT
jgi:hypothetical protein